MQRPPEISSTSAAALAISFGVRPLAAAMPVQSLMRRVVLAQTACVMNGLR